MTHETHESVGNMHVKVTRSSGARGDVRIPFTTKDETAKKGKDFQVPTNEIIFHDNEYE